MARDLLFEIGTEELPWGAVREGREQLRDNAAAILERERLEHGSMALYSTPRRLALLVRGVEEMQRDEESVARGPSREAAFDAQGNPTRAAEGFARSKGVSSEELEIRETERGAFVFAVVKKEGKPALEVLPGILEEILRSFNFRKSMRWGEGEFRFARPVRWLMALFGDQVVPLHFEGLRSGAATRGHRFLSSGEVKLALPGDYPAALRESMVLADEEERRGAILSGMEEIAAASGLRVVSGGDTLDEVVDLVEYPHVVMGSFEERYLELPREVLETAMQEHQRYFPLQGEGRGLAAAFLVVHNGDPTQEEVIRRGNERVLRARLDDASFFYQEDLRVSIDRRLQELKNVVWQAQLGSMYDKCQRLREICVDIGRAARLPDEVRERAAEAASLCKSDLVSAVVTEFPSLQGTMGRIYALEEGRDEETAWAVEEHYRPRFSGDALPLTMAGAVLSLAEKIDNLAGCFGAGLVPTGSEDPYALRRQAQALMAVLVDAGMHLDVAGSVDRAAGRLGFSDTGAIADQVGDFCLQRWRQMLISEGFSYDLVDAALADALRDPLDARGRLEALQRARVRGVLQRAYTGFERCYNLSRKDEGFDLEEDLLVEEAERELYSRMTWAVQPLRDLLDEGEYDSALEVLLELAPPVDRFFDEIFVMGDDERLRTNRLALLREVSGLFLEFADFSRVVTE